MTIPHVMRVLIVDDHPMIRQGLRRLLQAYADVEVVGEASDGDDALVKAGELRPALIVMDISMRRMDGITSTRLIKTEHPHIAVLGWSVSSQSYYIDAMLKAGASEVITKDKPADQLYDAMQRLHRLHRIFHTPEFREMGLHERAGNKHLA